MIRHRPVDDGERRVKAAKIYCGKVPQKYPEDELRTICSKYGDVMSFFYMEDCSGCDAGWFLATFESIDHAKAAVAGFQASYSFETRLSSGNSFAGGNQLPTTQNEEEHEKASSSAPLKHDKASSSVAALAKEDKEPPPQRGNWRQYETKEGGHKYYFNIETKVTTWEKPVEFQVAAPPPPPPKVVLPPGAGPIGFGGTGPIGANLFVHHMPPSWVETEFAQHFASFGKIVAARIFRDETGTSKGFGFVSYDNPQSAIQAIHTMNGFMIDGRAIKVSIKRGEEEYHLNAMAQ